VKRLNMHTSCKFMYDPLFLYNFNINKISASFHFGVSSDEPIKILNLSCGLDLVLDGLVVQ